MTRAGLERWLTAKTGRGATNYDRLLGAAKQIVDDPDDAAEVLHNAILGLLVGDRLAKVRHPWTYIVNRIHGYATNRRASNSAREKFTRGHSIATEER